MTSGAQGSADRQELISAIGRALSTQNWFVACAESCTGGWLGKALTDAPGAGVWYKGSVVAYHNDVKTSLLGVSEASLIALGAVSRAVAEEMAEGASEVLGADVAVSVTGIAGPAGGSPEKPVGTVWIGVHSPSGTFAQHFFIPGDREAVRRKAVHQALQALLETVS